MARLHKVQECVEPAAEVVLIHGLGGHWERTWTGPGETYWPVALARDFPRARVWCLEYDAAPAAFLGQPMPLEDRAKNILTAMRISIAGSVPIVIVGHSMGGVIAKAVLRKGVTQSDQQDWQELCARVESIVFLATPHVGSHLASLASALFPGLITPAMTMLKANDDALRSLLEWYRGYVGTGARIRTVVCTENKMFRAVWVVEPNSADPGIIGAVPLPIDADHRAICAPAHRHDLVYRLIEEQVGRTLGERPLLSSEPMPSRDGRPSQPANARITPADAVNAARAPGRVILAIVITLVLIAGSLYTLGARDPGGTTPPVETAALAPAGARTARGASSVGGLATGPQHNDPLLVGRWACTVPGTQRTVTVDVPAAGAIALAAASADGAVDCVEEAVFPALPEGTLRMSGDSDQCGRCTLEREHERLQLECPDVRCELRRVPLGGGS